MADVCDILTISDSDCRLTFYNSGSDPIRILDLSDTKIDVSDMPDLITVYDNNFSIIVFLSQLPSINGGSFTALQDLIYFIQPLIDGCKCPCPGGGAGTLDEVLTAGNDGAGKEILNIADPTTPQSASTKAYNDSTNATTLATAEAYADSLVVGLWDDRGNFDASVAAYPSTGGSGTAGAILKGDIWTVSVAGTLPTGQVVNVGDTVRSLINTPGNTQANWAIGENNIGYVPENQANKTNTVVGNEASTTLYLSVKGYYDYLIGLTWLTNSIFGTWMAGINSKTNPVNADSIIISDSSDSNKAKNVTFTNLKAFLKTYFDTIYQAVLVSGTNIKTINGNNLLGSGNVAVGDALVANPLNQFAATTSAQLASIVTDETGSGALVFASAPTLSNPIVGTQSPGDNSTKAASTAFVTAAITAGVPVINAWAETPTGTINSINTVFTLANTPADTDGVIVTLGGTVQRNGIDYSVAGTTITFVAAPTTGDEIFAYYNTSTASSTIQQFNYRCVTATDTVVATDAIIELNGTFTETLLTAVGRAGQTFTMKNSGVGLITVNTSLAQTIDGSASTTITSLNAKNFTSNGANWIIT